MASTGVATNAVALAKGASNAHASTATAAIADDELIFLGNSSLSMTWSTAGGSLRGNQFVDALNARTLDAPPSPFLLTLAGSRNLSASQMRIVGGPIAVDLLPQTDAVRLADRLSGKAVTLELADDASGLRVSWRAIQRDGSDYIRQEITLSAPVSEVLVTDVRLLQWQLPQANVVGNIPGSPIVDREIFAGFEHPLAVCTVNTGSAECVRHRYLPIRPGLPVTYSSVIGVTVPGQLRRGFTRYLELERAHPYRTTLNYNTFWDLGVWFFESDALNSIQAIGTELHDRRGVTIDNFHLDDGWDDPPRLWEFNERLPAGFRNLRAATQRYGATMGVWFSPRGGYGTEHDQRLAAGAAAGYEIWNDGLALNDPQYYGYFRDVNLQMINEYGATHLKWDGVSPFDHICRGGDFDSDLEAVLHLSEELRAAAPSLYINLTTGASPSPFWLRHVDSVWRGDFDWGFAGKGSDRQRWITYRDGIIYQNLVVASPLFPLNSVTVQGVMFARHVVGLQTATDADFADDVHAFFASGTQMQELFITPSFLSPSNWDDLAEAARWSRDNAATLVDTHWIGGDPNRMEIYGWASWSPSKGILALRNPGPWPQTFTVALAHAFELPGGAAGQNFQLRSAWRSPRVVGTAQVSAAATQSFTLQPFQVMVLEAVPARESRIISGDIK